MQRQASEGGVVRLAQMFSCIICELGIVVRRWVNLIIQAL